MVSWFQNCKKANIFNDICASICAPIHNSSCLPSFTCRTGSRIKSFHVTDNAILAIMKTLDPNKAGGCDNKSIKMIKICSFHKYGKRQMYFLLIKKKTKG